MTAEIIMMTLFRKGKETMIRIVDFLDLTCARFTQRTRQPHREKGLHVSLHAPTQSDRPKGELLSHTAEHNRTMPPRQP